MFALQSRFGLLRHFTKTCYGQFLTFHGPAHVNFRMEPSHVFQLGEVCEELWANQPKISFGIMFVMHLSGSLCEQKGVKE